MKKNSIFFYLFILAFVFQLTMLRFIWKIEALSRVVNAIYLVACLMLLIISFSKSYKDNVWKYYFLPGILVSVGLIVNILSSSISNFSVLAQLGSVIPWLLFLLVPYFCNRKSFKAKDLWNYSYHIMVIFVFLGLIDYYSIYIAENVSRYLETPYGDFIGGNFSLLHVLSDGSAHFRFYSVFAEPGTLAMFLLPFIAYSFLERKYFGLSILSIGFAVSFSLGGVLGLLVLILLLGFYKTRNNAIFIGLICMIIVSFVGIFKFGQLVRGYEDKGNSASTREENFSDALVRLPILIYKWPLGLPLNNSTSETEKNALYSGSNFIPGNYLQKGGVLSFIGYLLFLSFSLRTSFKVLSSKGRKHDNETVVVAMSTLVMVPFLFQRPTIFESVLFAFLFAPSLLNVLTGIIPRGRGSRL